MEPAGWGRCLDSVQRALRRILSRGLAGSGLGCKDHCGHLVDSVVHPGSGSHCTAQWCSMLRGNARWMKPEPKCRGRARASLWDHHGAGGLLLLQDKPLTAEGVSTLTPFHPGSHHPVTCACKDLTSQLPGKHTLTPHPGLVHPAREASGDICCTLQAATPLHVC